MDRAISLVWLIVATVLAVLWLVGVDNPYTP